MNSNTPSVISTDLNPEKLPSHVAIIMDGNGRWAKKRLLNRIKGHEKGSETVRTIVRTCRKIGIPHFDAVCFLHRKLATTQIRSHRSHVPPKKIPRIRKNRDAGQQYSTECHRTDRTIAGNMSGKHCIRPWI